jgi:Zn-dependent membrane protease YugP/Flp pilus assembly protein TadD
MSVCGGLSERSGNNIDLRSFARLVLSCFVPLVPSSEWSTPMMPTLLDLYPVLVMGIPPLLGIPIIWLMGRLSKNTNTCYYATPVACGLAGCDVAKRLLDAAGLSHIAVSSGSKLDLYDWSKHEIRLQPGTFTSATLPALAIAAHEVGHAVQFDAGYLPALLRWGLRLFIYFSFVIWFLAIAMPWTMTLLPHQNLANFILLFVLVLATLQLLATLVSERDATRRGRELAIQNGLITPGEQRGFNRVLKGCFLTYVARVSTMAMILAGLFVVLVLDQSVISKNTVGNGVLCNKLLSAELLRPEILPKLLMSVAGLAFFCIVLFGSLILFRHLRSRELPRTANKSVERNNAAAVHLQQGHWEAALAEYSEAIRLQPSLAAAYAGRGTAMTQLRRFDEALADLDVAIRLMPGVASFFAGRGVIHIHRCDYDRALADTNEALRLSPGSTDALRTRSVVWLRKGDFKQAIEDAEQVIRSNPNDFIAINNRGAALAKIGEYDRAIADFREAIRLNSAFPNPYKHLAWLQATCPRAELRDGAQAVTNATRALELAAWKPIDWLAVLVLKQANLSC